MDVFAQSKPLIIQLNSWLARSQNTNVPKLHSTRDHRRWTEPVLATAGAACQKSAQFPVRFPATRP